MRHLTIALASFLVTIVPSYAQSQKLPNTPATQKLEPDLNKNYWTEERRRNAKPIDLPRLTKAEFDRLRKGPPLLEEASRDSTLPLRDSLIFGIPAQVDPRQSPYVNAGHLYFSRDGEDRVCTAQFVGDPTVLLTAAHCLRNATTGAWSTNFVFHRAFDNGSSLQQVQIVCPAAFEGWVIETGLDRFRWDYGFLKTSTPSTSGHFGLTVGLPHAAWEAIGYPANFGGNLRMQKVSGTKGAVYRNRVEMLGNPMRRGNSGGAWHVNGYAIGNESFDVEGENNTMWSPYYDDNVLTLWQFALRGCQ